MSRRRGDGTSRSPLRGSVLLTAILLAACGLPAPPAAVGTGGPGPVGAAASEAYQSLYRVHYEGGGGDGSLRLLLYSSSPTRFQLKASAAVGQAGWSLDFDHGRLLLVDHRAETFCRTDGGLRIPQLEVGALSVAMVPALLAGRLPVEPPPGAASRGRLDFRDREGRRWTARLDAGAPVSWVLWDERGPLAWWTRQDAGGILSHRDGEQYRWQESVREPLAGPLRDLEIPDTYRETSCDEPDLSELRQDQPPPAGGGPPG